MKNKLRKLATSKVANICMSLAVVGYAFGSNACFLFFYEPEQPEMAKEISAKDLKTMLRK